MITELTKKQSAKLVELGIPKEKASKKPLIFTITDLFEILPKTIKANDFICDLNISWCNIYKIYIVTYDSWISDYVTEAEELIHALYKMIIKLIKGGYIKL